MDGRGSHGPVSTSAELRLVMCMLSAPATRSAWGDPVALCSTVSWERFLTAADEKVRPYLHWASEQSSFAAHVPAPVALALAQARFSTRIRNLRWATELRQIAAAFRGADIALMMLKGSALQRTVYPDPSTRPMNDVDLLVRREDLQRVDELMTGLGFLRRTSLENHTPNPGLESDEEAYYLKKVGDGILFVEVHTRTEVAERAPVASPTSLWDHRIEVEGRDGLLVPTLEPQMALRHLCLHLAKHNFDYGLMWLLDIRLYLERYGSSIDWDEFIGGCERQTLPHIAFTLTIAADWLGADVPTSKLAPFLPEQHALATALAWEQMTDQVRERKPPNAVLLALSGNPVRIWKYLRVHFRQWTMPIPGRTTHPMQLLARRFWSDLRIFRAAFLAGGFRWANIRTAARSDRRAEQLRVVFQRGHKV